MPSPPPPKPARAWPAIDGRHFGDAFDAFPVEAPFQVRPDLVKLAPADDWLRVDREWPAMLAAKQAALAGDERLAAADNIMLATPADARTEQRRLAAIMRIGERLAATAAGRRLRMSRSGEEIAFGAAGYRAAIASGAVRLTADRADPAPVLRALSGGRGASVLLGAIAMSLQEDLVLMEQGPDGVARAAVFHVSFPSAWNPAAKLGQDLLALHSPVADNASLQAAAARLGNALVAKGPFVRWVWTVTTDSRWRAWPPQSALSATSATTAPSALPGMPAVSAAPAGAGAGDGAAATGDDTLFFRLERQTTMPLGEGYGLFVIRVQLRRLEDVLAAPGRLALLQASLRSMSEDMVRYKNLAAVRRALLDR